MPPLPNLNQKPPKNALPQSPVLPNKEPQIMGVARGVFDSQRAPQQQMKPIAPVSQMPNLLPKKGMAIPQSFKTGGIVEKTGMAKVHKGEVVIPVDETSNSAGGYYHILGQEKYAVRSGHASIYEDKTRNTADDNRASAITASHPFTVDRGNDDEESQGI